MGGKTGTTTQKVSIPPEVLARYNAVNARAEQVAATPFQPYNGQFVAGITPTQQAGINATTQYAQAAQPYYQAATQQLGQAQGQGQQAIQQAFGSLGQGVDVGQQYAQAATGGIGAALQGAQPYQAGATAAAMAGAQQLTPENINIQGYMNPYNQAVADTTYQALRQQQQQEMGGQTANAIRSGAFGGDRSGLVAANLARQQQLGTAQAMAPIYQQGYSQALGTAMTAAQQNRAALQNLSQQLQGIGQQGYGQQMGAAQQMAALGQQQYGQGLGAAQQLGALGQQQYGMGAGTAQQLAALGSGAQQSALQGAQAQLGAGTLEQQTQQADMTARYQQFLQERGYPFQVAQFLANIAMGTGALSGSTTTTQQPMPFFSDRRVKHDVKEIGKTHDGQPIYSFKYNGDDATRIGLMAQDVEKTHPEAVHDMGGIKGVDYKEATKDSEREERYAGGLVPASMGGAVNEPGAYNRGGYSIGGDVVDPNDLQAILQQQQEAFGPFGESGIYGGSHHQAPFSAVKGVVPQTRMHVAKLAQPGAAPRLPESGASQAVSAFDTAMDMKKRYDTAKEAAKSAFGETPQSTEDRTRQGQTGTDRKGLAGPDIVPDKKTDEEKGLLDYISGLFKADGGAVPRSRYAIGGASKDPSLPYDEEDKSPYKYFPTELLETEKPELQKPNQAPGQTSQTGVGVGDLAKLAMFFLKDGGSVPRAHYQDGGDADLERYLNAIAKIESSNNPKAIGPQTKSGDRAYGLYQVMGSNVPSWTEEAVGRRMTPDEFLADEEAQRATARHQFGKSLKQYGNPEDAASVWFSGRPMSKAGNASDVLGTTVPDYINKFRAAADLPTTNAKPSNGIVPAVKEASAGIAPTSKEGSTGIIPSVKSYLAENQDWLVPFGAGLKGMVQSRSPFLGGALLEGVGSGLEAVGGAQKQLADIGLTKATAFQTGSQIPPGYVYIGTDANGRPMFALRSEMLADTAKTPTAPLSDVQKQTIEQGKAAVSGEPPAQTGAEKPVSTAPTQQAGPIVSTVENGRYNYKVQPTQIADKKFAPLGYKGSPDDKYRIQDVISATPRLMEQQKTETKLWEERKALASNTAMMRQDINMLSDAVLGISKEGLTSVGPGQESRARLVNLWNWSVDNAGLGENKIDAGSDISNAQIIQKLRASAGIGKAGAAGFHAASVAQAINDAQPSGELDEKASRKLIASMMVQNQMPEDFVKYGDEYGSKYGGLLYADNSFKEDVGQRYEAEKNAFADALIPVQMPDGTYKSRLQWLRENPSRAAEFENHYKLPGIARLALGG